MRAILTSALLCALAVPALCVSAAPARAQDTSLRGGEWTSTVSGMGAAPMTSTVCLADMKLDQMTDMNQPGMTCTKRDVTRIPGGVRIDMVCEGMEMRGTALSTGQDAYKTDMTMTMAGSPAMRMVTESRRVGACKPGDTPMNKP